MKKLAELFGSSSRELKSVRTITVCAMLAAAAIILVNFRIELTNTQSCLLYTSPSPRD